MLDNFNKNESGAYVSDYPEVFFTEPNVRNQNNFAIPNYTPPQNRSSIFSLFNSDLFKQFLPLLFNGKGDNKIMSLLQGSTPSVSDLVKSLSSINLNEKPPKTKNENIIDMQGYEEVE